MKKLILVGLMLAIGGGLRAQEASTRGFMHRSKFFSGTISDMMPQLKVLSDLQLKETNEAAKNIQALSLERIRICGRSYPQSVHT